MDKKVVESVFLTQVAVTGLMDMDNHMVLEDLSQWSQDLMGGQNKVDEFFETLNAQIVDIADEEVLASIYKNSMLYLYKWVCEQEGKAIVEH